jgi:hypothetical protein
MRHQHMSQLFRRAPAADDLEGPPYYEAEPIAFRRTNDELTQNNFKWWFVEHWAEYANAADAWDSAEWKDYLKSITTPKPNAT